MVVASRENLVLSARIGGRGWEFEVEARDVVSAAGQCGACSVQECEGVLLLPGCLRSS